MTSRRGSTNDLPWMREIILSSPEAAQWMPEGDELLVIEPLGFLLYRKVAPNEHEILNLAVRPEARRTGVATQLLKDVLAEKGNWFLEVRTSNSAARNLYQSVGFQESGRRPKYYKNPDEDAVVLVFQSC